MWFDRQAEEAAAFYTGIFRNSKIGTVSRYGEAGFEFHKMPAGTALVVAFELEGQAFTALNGGPKFKFNEAISFQVYLFNDSNSEGSARAMNAMMQMKKLDIAALKRAFSG